MDYSSEYEGKEGKKVVKEKLLNPHDSLPIGEFAIGTNTREFFVFVRNIIWNQSYRY